MPNLIISPVGTSLLTNNSGPDFALLRDTANLKGNELTAAQKSRIDEIALAKAEILDNTKQYSEFKDLSAELNGIFSYKVPDNRDHHILIATDTYQCRLVSQIIADVLKRYDAVAEIPEFNGLSTRSKEAFESGIDQIVSYMSSAIDGYIENGYRIVFNLTGGFKAVIGYLNLLAMFYADEILYIFERNEELIRIPRMPIKIDEEKLGNVAPLLAMLDQPAAAMTVSKLNNAGVDTRSLYESLFTVISSGDDSCISLSTYGKLVWNTLKEEKYKELIQFPYLVYTDRFRSSFDSGRARKEFQRRANAALALLSALLIESDFNMTALGGNSTLDYGNLHQGVGHFRISNRPLSYRGFCVPKDGKLVMLDCGEEELDNKYDGITPDQALR